MAVKGKSIKAANIKMVISMCRMIFACRYLMDLEASQFI